MINDIYNGLTMILIKMFLFCLCIILLAITAIVNYAKCETKLTDLVLSFSQNYFLEYDPVSDNVRYDISRYLEVDHPDLFEYSEEHSPRMSSSIQLMGIIISYYNFNDQDIFKSWLDLETEYAIDAVAWKQGDNLLPFISMKYASGDLVSAGGSNAIYLVFSNYLSTCIDFNEDTNENYNLGRETYRHSTIRRIIRSNITDSIAVANKLLSDFDDLPSDNGKAEIYNHLISRIAIGCKNSNGDSINELKEEFMNLLYEISNLNRDISPELKEGCSYYYNYLASTKPRVIWAFFNNMKGDSNCKRMLSIQDTCVLS